MQAVDNFEDPTNRKKTFFPLKNIQTNKFALLALLIFFAPKDALIFFFVFFFKDKRSKFIDKLNIQMCRQFHDSIAKPCICYQGIICHLNA